MRLINKKKLQESKIRDLQSQFINKQNLIQNKDNLNIPTGHTTDV